MKLKLAIALIVLISVPACTPSGTYSNLNYKPIILTDQTISCAAESDLSQIRDHNDAWLCEHRGKNCPKKKIW